MLNVANVVERFANLSGLSGDAVNPWIYICEDSVEEIRSRLRPNVSEEENSKKLNSAAATLSFYKYVLCISIKDDLNPENQYVSNPYTKNLAMTLWNEQKEEIANLLCDNNFAFKSV